MAEKIVVSMTSYPARIKYVSKVWFSVLKQIKPEYNCKCVLVLAKPEFPNLEKDLPDDLNLMVKNDLIEIIWTETNIRSHKKLMPVLKKYPNDSILIIDDDQYRPDGWLKIFIEDHKTWPTDVLAGRIQQREVNGHFVWQSVADTERGKIIKFGRSQNGRGGTLYPPGVFTDKEFFDEKLYMTYSPTSDESWQYFWLKKHDIWPRATSSYIKDEKLVIQAAQKTALWNKNKLKYDTILKKLNEVFGEK